MTYSLPFELKQKPLPHYFDGGVIKFSCREGILYYTVKQIEKTLSGTLTSGRVESKEHLDKILNVKTLYEIHTIEEVVS